MKAINDRCRVALWATVAALCAMAEAVEFSKAGYWEAEGSPRCVETMTAGWEFSLDGFKTGKAVTLPHGIDDGELGFEASGCVNRQQPAYVADTDKGGVRITSNLGADGKWTVRADVTLGGDVEGAKAELFYDGKPVTSPFNPDSPALWPPETPNLHWLRVDVKKGGRLTDSVRVRFGIRDFKATLDGLVLNGKPYDRRRASPGSRAPAARFRDRTSAIDARPKFSEIPYGFFV